MSDTDTTYYLYQLLTERHVTPNRGEWATFAELQEAPIGGQRIDFFAVHTWKSKKYLAVAFEIKASRSDFLKELRSPEKRIFAERVSHESYFVAPPGLIRPHEVPENWGLMEPRRGTRELHVIKRAQRRANVNWSQDFIMAMVRRAADKLPKQYELLDFAPLEVQWPSLEDVPEGNDIFRQRYGAPAGEPTQ